MVFKARVYRVAILLSVIILMAQSLVMAASPAAVKWADLEEHLARRAVVMESMAVVDCPAAIDGESAEHLVCQVIENTFYQWKEYEFFDAAGGKRLALEMIKPEARRLTADEAQVLLNASKLVGYQTRESSLGLMTRPPDEVPSRGKSPVFTGSSRVMPESGLVEMPVDDFFQTDELRSVHLNELPSVDEAAGIRESIHGSDDRIRVASRYDITSYPWNTICYLDFMVSGSSYRGSGISIAPYCVMTCGHNLWDQDLQVWSDSMKVTPAQHQEYQGGTIYEPYGTVGNCRLSSNTVYTDHNGGFEYDYGVVKLGQRFSGISTFIPIEYDATPTVVNIAGYPAEVQNESASYDMWYCDDDGKVIGYEGVSDRIMLYKSDTSGGQSGAPVWKYNEETKSRRLVAIHVYGSATDNGACRLVSAMETVITEWMQYEPDVGYTNFSYIPYLSTGSSRWTGVALANYNGAANNVKIEYFSSAGSHLGSEFKSIPAYGQTSFPTATAVGTEGWIKISSTEPLIGLALIGDSEYATMFDIDLKTSLHRKFLCPHLAANEDWRSFALVCNPNDIDARISFTYYDIDGSLVSQMTTPPIPAHGSVNYSLFGLFQQELNGGTLVIETVQPVTAFLLYDNKSTTWKAGLSAVPID